MNEEFKDIDPELLDENVDLINQIVQPDPKPKKETTSIEKKAQTSQSNPKKVPSPIRREEPKREEPKKAPAQRDDQKPRGEQTMSKKPNPKQEKPAKAEAKPAQAPKQEPAKEHKEERKVTPIKRKAVETDDRGSRKVSKKTIRNRWIAVAVVALIAIGLFAYFTYFKDLPKAPAAGSYKDTDAVASVNGETITYKQMMDYYNSLPAQYQMFMTPEMSLNQTILETLFRQEADKKNIKVSEQEAKDALESWIAGLKTQLGEEQFQSALAQQGMTEQELRDKNLGQFQKQLLLTKLFNETIFKEITVTDADAQAYFDENKEQFSTPEMVNAAHVLICFTGAQNCNQNRTDAQALALATDIENRAKAGEDFAALAKNYSEDPGSKNTGGNYTFGKGMMVPEFETLAFSLETGEVGTTKTAFGYHVIKLLAKYPAATASFSSAKADIVKALETEKQRAAMETYASRLQNSSSILIYYKTPGVQGADGIKTFSQVGGETCMEDGKPIVRMYSTTTCPHCKWVGATFDKVAKEYAGQGKIVAHHWELDKKDDLLTSTVENAISDAEIAVFQKYNPQNTVPTFVFGCKYVRIANGYEADKDLGAEEAEFRAVINKLLTA